MYRNEPEPLQQVSGIVLAGVHRWDRSSLDELLPRPLMPIVHTPLICHVLGWLRDAGIARAAVCGNSASRLMQQRLTDGAALGIELSYYDDRTPRGPAGCIRDSAALLPGDRVVVADGALLPADCDLHAVLAEHRRSGAAMTVVAAPDPDGPNGGRARLVPVGIYVLERCVLEHISPTGYQDVKEMLLPRLHERGVPARAHTLAAACPRVTDAASYVALNGWVLEQLLHRNQTPLRYRRVGRSLVHESAQVASPDRLVGAVLIGPGTVLAPDATVVGPTTIGTECVIEPQAAVSCSVLWDRCRVGRRATVDHHVLGEGVRVENGARLFHTTWAHDVGRPRELAGEDVEGEAGAARIT